MSNCNTQNCCFKGIDLVIKCYDPQPDFRDFTIPTWWFNRCNGKLFLLKEIDDNGKAVWIDITSGGSTIEGIEEIITECGLIQPDSEGKVKVKGTCGIRAAAEGCEDLCVNVLTGFGLKGGGQVCVGETITIELDAEITGDVRSEGTPQIGDIPKYKEADSKIIVPSNINSVDGLTKITKSTKGEQKFLVETADTESGSNAGVEAKSTGSGFPYFQLTQGDQKWRERINPETGAREICPIDDLSKDPILSMLPNGVMFMPWQPKCTAKLSQSTPVFTAGQDYQIGSTLAFTKIRDTDGYNESANHFFPGDGNGNYAYYTCPYTGGYSIGWLFLADRTTKQDTQAEVKFKLVFGPISNEQSLLYRYFFGNLTFTTVSGYITLPLNKGDRIRWNINIDKIPNGQPYINSLSGANEIDNFIGILFLG